MRVILKAGEELTPIARAGKMYFNLALALDILFSALIPPSLIPPVVLGNPFGVPSCHVL